MKSFSMKASLFLTKIVERSFNLTVDTVIIGGNMRVKRMGLGTNRLRDSDSARKLLNTALELGIQFIDTADIYTVTESETTIAKMLSPYKQGLVIATKGGMMQRTYHTNNDPQHLRNAIDASLKRLKLERIDLYQLHRVDTQIPLAQTMGVLKEAQKAGKIQHIGLSEVTVSQIEEARKHVDIVSVQNHYNLVHRKYEDVVDYCERENLVFIPFFPLAIGRMGPAQETVERIAKSYHATVSQIALAYLLKRSPCILPIPGTLSVEHLKENFEALALNLKDEDYRTLFNLA